MPPRPSSSSRSTSRDRATTRRSRSINAAPVRRSTSPAAATRWRCTSTAPRPPVSRSSSPARVAAGDVYSSRRRPRTRRSSRRPTRRTAPAWFNGDDAVVLRRARRRSTDRPGRLDPGTEWGTGVTSTMDHVGYGNATSRGRRRGADPVRSRRRRVGTATAATTPTTTRADFVRPRLPARANTGAVGRLGGPPTPTNPSDIGAATPNVRSTGAATTLTVTVTPGANPAPHGTRSPAT